MKYILLANIFFLFWSKFNRIAEVNSIKEKAAVFFENKEYKSSALLYEKLIKEYKEENETVRLNLANCYFQMSQYNIAIDNYKILTKSENPIIRSKSYLQLGVIYGSNTKKELGLSYFKEALKANPENEEARYNYTLLKKDIAQAQKEASPDKKKENKNGKESSNSTSENSNKKSKNTEDNNKSNGQDEEESEGDDSDGGDNNELEFNTNGDKETDVLRANRLAEMNMSERQARMILKTMKNAEIQYIQQRKKIIRSTSANDKPDW